MAVTIGYVEQTVGYNARTDGEIIEGQTFAGYNIGIIVYANHVTIRRCTFRNLQSNGSNGTGIVVRVNTVGIKIVDCEVDGTDGVSHGAGISLHNGSRSASVVGCHIHHMQRVGISMGSTTYIDFAKPLPEMSEHYIARNTIEYCGTVQREGDAGSGLVIVGQSHRHTIRENFIRRNFGHGVVLSGSVRGDGTPGSAAFDESPTWNTVAENIIEYNGGDGIRNMGANYTWIRKNFCYANGGAPIRVESLGATSDSRGVLLDLNRAVL